MTNMIIDIHAHYLPKLLIERFETRAPAFPGVTLARTDKGVTLQFPGSEPTRPISPKLSDLEERKAWMRQNQIDHQLVGGWLDSFGYELPAAEGLAWSRFINECMWDGLKTETRFTPLASVPLQNGKYADPRKGFEAMFFDSLVFDPDGLDFLIKKAGKGRVMLGSDMPFPIGDPAPQKVVPASSLDEHERCAVLGTTALEVFCLRHDAARDPIGGA